MSINSRFRQMARMGGQQMVSAIRRATGLTSISDLFKDGSNGAWFGPSDLWGGAQRLVRRNLLTSTATLATQTKSVAALSHTLYIKGTGSVTLSGAATGTLNGTGASNRVSLAFTPTAGNLTLTVSGTVTEGHLTETRTTDHTYQAVTDWTTEQYAYAAATQYPWLRRNLLLNSAQPTMANVSAGSATASILTADYADGPVTGTRAARLQCARTGTTTGDYSLRSTAALNIPANITTTESIWIKSNTGISQSVVFYEGYKGVGLVATATTLWQRVSLSGSSSATQRSVIIGTRGGSGNYFNGGDLSIDILIYCPQVEISSVKSDAQPIGASWDAQYAANEAAAGHVPVLFQDRAGTNPVNADGQTAGKILDKSGRGNHATAATDANRPLLKQDGNGNWYTQGDGVDDALVAQFGSNQGTACAEYVSGASSSTETTGITINTTRSVHGQAANYGTVIRTSPESEPKRSQLLILLDKLAGR